MFASVIRGRTGALLLSSTITWRRGTANVRAELYCLQRGYKFKRDTDRPAQVPKIPSTITYTRIPISSASGEPLHTVLVNRISLGSHQRGINRRRDPSTVSRLSAPAVAYIGYGYNRQQSGANVYLIKLVCISVDEG